jgi:hypothetical protein
MAAIPFAIGHLDSLNFRDDHETSGVDFGMDIDALAATSL